MVPLSWALRAAGHELIVASTEGLVPAIRDAGLPAVVLGQERPDVTRRMTGFYFDWLASLPGPARVEDVRKLGPHAVAMYVAMAEATIDDTLRFARTWRPDLVVYDPTTFVGPLTAAAVNVPAARHIWGMDYTSVTRQFEPEALGKLCSRIGVDPMDTLGTVTLDPCPPSLQTELDVARLPMRFVPYNGPGVLQPWHLETPTRPRIVLLASSIAELYRETDSAKGLFAAVLRGLAGLNVEVLAIAGSRTDAFLESLPANVRVIDPTPLHLLLPTCDLVIHQGGGGTVMTSLAYGVPQLLLPMSVDHVWNAGRLTRSGAGDWLSAESVTAEAVRDHVERLLEDRGPREQALRLREEMAAQPSAAQVVDSLERLVAERGVGNGPALLHR
ncbi:nucleotide disphospho-sugar-binding domain-containing protein [Streptomyces sp. NPDC042638]|uniref:nucleotide disphospho-sugar-binding domain-containing protein n=1 Tax=Streptomyces sp. NPDC042638 TaxID=3154333 RepID=UPI0033EA0DDF